MSSTAQTLPVRERLAGGALTAGAIALHLERYLHAGGLWRDEAGAARLAVLPSFHDIYALFPHEAFPLLFPALVRLYGSGFGFSDAALRAFGLLVGAAIVAIVWRNAAATAGSVPLISMALLGFDARFVAFGDSVRGYGLGCAFVLLTYGTLAMLLRPDPWEGSPWRRRLLGVALAASAVASVQVLQGNAALLFALCASGAVVAAVRRRHALAAWILACGALAALSLLPYAPVLAAARRDWSILVIQGADGARIWHMFVSTLGPRAVAWLWLALLAAAFVGLTRQARARREGQLGIASLPGSASNSREVIHFAALTVATGFLATGAFLALLGYPPRAWYYLPLLAVLASALDTIFGELLRGPHARRLARLRVGAVALVVVVELGPSPRDLQARQTNIDLAASAVAATARAGDLVVVNPWFFGVSFARYYRGSAGWRTLPDLADHRVHRYDLLKAKLMASDPIGDVLLAADRTLQAGHRVFVVGRLDPPASGAAPAVVPPAPTPAHGWRATPYERSWSRQLACFLGRRAATVSPLAIPEEGPVSDLEHVGAWVFAGSRAAAVAYPVEGER